MLSKSATMLLGLINKRSLNAYEITKQLQIMNVHPAQAVPKGKGATVTNAFTSRRLGLYPCCSVPYQQGED